MLNGVSTLLVACRQWGDTGKGKFVDLFADWADIIVRGTGGDNAGHTICCGTQELVTHLVPSGILYNAAGKINIIGSGTVVYPKTLVEELDLLKHKGLSFNNLMLAYNAKLITPAEILLDRIREASNANGKIGSTGKGIGPTYTDFYDRQGLTINDLANPSFLRRKLERHLDYKRQILKNYDPQLIKAIMWDDHLESGLYYHPQTIFNTDAIFEKYCFYAQDILLFMADTDEFIRSSLGQRRILGEGAQGDLLSICRGTYPYVTSSDCTTKGLAEGMGLNPRDIDLSLGIIKGFYMTRVGRGPFPTELGGQDSDNWCNGGEANRSREAELYPGVNVNNQDEFLQGVALRQAGNEYGATTGRPRRIGWLDLPLLRYVLKFNSPDVILTKLDVLNDCEEIRIAKEYKYTGSDYYHRSTFSMPILSGCSVEQAIPNSEFLENCSPIYQSFPGWKSDLRACRSQAGLPEELKNILDFVVKQTGIKPRVISVGPDREDTIFL